MSDKKEKKKRTKKAEEVPENVEQRETQQNMITFNPNTEISFKLGNLVNIRNLIGALIDNHPEIRLNSDEVIRLGTSMEDINKIIRQNALSQDN